MNMAVLAASLFPRLTFLTCIKSQALAHVQHLHFRAWRKQSGKGMAADLPRAEQVCLETGFNVPRTEASSFVSFTRHQFIKGAQRR